MPMMDTIGRAETPEISKGKTIRQLPVTLLSGFLGSGKTTLMEHILKSPDHGLRIAVIVNDMSSINIDASLISNHVISSSKEKLIQLQNGCICCTLRGDLLESLVELARNGDVEYVLIESTGISEPQQVAETFTTEFTAAMIEQGAMEEDNEDNAIMKEIAELGGLNKLARLDTCVTVIDAFNLFSNFHTPEFLSDRKSEGAVPEEDDRTISDLLVDQIEFADVIIVNKIDTVDSETKGKILRSCKALNPSAKVLEANFSRVDVREIINTGRFDFEKASLGSGWLRSLHELSLREVNGVMKVSPKPETEEYGVNNFVYRARRPFHPKRLFSLLHDKFILLQNVETHDDEDGSEEDEDEDMKDEEQTFEGFGPVDGEAGQDESSNNESDSEDYDDARRDSGIKLSDNTKDLDMKDFSAEIPTALILANKAKHPAFSPLLRSKGFFWLATRTSQHGEWSQAGGILTLQGGGPWFCTVPRESWPADPEVAGLIEADFKGEWGDRRQEIVCIGEGVDVELVTRTLDECLLTEGEMKRWGRIMGKKGLTDEEREGRLCKVFEDGFEDWATTPMEVEEQAHEGHDHAHGRGHHH